MPAMTERPFAPACERNQGPILQVLQRHLQGDERVLEIASGTGQHALHFTAALPRLRWQCTDLPDRLAGIDQWLSDGDPHRLPSPRPLDALAGEWPQQTYDAVYTANSFHIMPWGGGLAVFAALPALLVQGGRLIVYGPFRVGGEFVSPSDAQFDASLQARDPAMGLRDLEQVADLAERVGLQLLEHVAMPANNHCLVWTMAAADGNAHHQ